MRCCLRSVLIAEQLQDIQEHVHEVEIQVQSAQNGDLLDHLRPLRLDLREQRAGALRIIDGHAGEQHQADRAHDLGHGSHIHEHQHELRDDQHNQSDHENRTGLEHIELRGHAEHGQREEECRSDAQSDPDGAEIIHHENRTQRESHNRRVQIKHDASHCHTHLHDTNAKHNSHDDGNHTQRDQTNHACGP